MSQFEISPEGRVSDVTVREIVAKLVQMFPETNAPAVEANLMVARSYGALTALVAPYWAEFGLTGHRYNVLRLLMLADGKRLPMKDIAAGLNVGTTNVTSLIDGLERDGLVRRVGAEEDKRVTYAMLTQEGEERFLAVYPHTSVRLRDAWAALSDAEKKVLVHLLAKLRMRLEVSSVGNDILSAIPGVSEPEPPEEPLASRPARPRRRARA